MRTILYDAVWEARDYGRIEKLLKLTNPDTFWDDVRKLVKNVRSDHTIHRWEILAGLRYKELTGGED